MPAGRGVVLALATAALLLPPAVPRAAIGHAPPAATPVSVLARDPPHDEPVSSSSRSADGLAISSPSNWSEFNITNPSARIFEGMAYDAADGYLLMFGGYAQGGLALNDTWIYRNQSWTELCSGTNVTPSCAVSPGAGAASMAYDPAEGYVLAIDNSGQSWAFQAGAWRALNASARPAECPSGAPPCGSTANPMIYDPATGQMIDLAWDRTTWGFSGGNWTQIGVTNNPACDSDAVMFYDSTYRTPVVFCSNSGDGYVLNGLNWTTLAPSTLPSGKLAAGDFDPNLGGLVTTWTGGPAYNATYTWTFQGGNWTNVSATLSHEPPAEVWGLMAFDPAYGYSVLLDGQRPGTTTNLNFTWALIDSFTASVTATSSVLEVGQNTTLNLSLVGGVPPFHASISGIPLGCPTPALGTAETCTPNQSGEYLIELSGTDAATNSTSSSDLLLEVYPAFAVQAAAEPANTTAGFTVSFVASIQGGRAPYLSNWDFGDGTNSTALSTSHTYGAPGTYPASFRANDSLGGAIVVPLMVRVNFGLELVAGPNSSVTDAGVPVAFHADPVAGTPPYTIVWAFEDGTPNESGAVVNHSFTAAGMYRVTVSATDAVGATQHDAINVSVNAAPTATLTVSDSKPYNGTYVTFTATEFGGTAPYLYAWTFGDGTSGGNNLSLPGESFTHRYVSAGNYTARLTLTDAVGISKSAEVNVSVRSMESAPGNGTSPPPSGLSESTLLAIGAGVGLAIAVVAVIGVLYSRRRRQAPPRGEAPL